MKRALDGLHRLLGELMRLAEFIRENTEAILVDWDAFAQTLPAAVALDIAALRDHAKEMLTVIVRDLETPQTPSEQVDKALGKADAVESGPPATAAQEHGASRAVSGFTVAQILAELRALRASVIRLWTKQTPRCTATDFEDMIRFNEAIDQTIAESITQYSEEIDQTKDRFLAILGHDLRNPLGAIITSARFMLELRELHEPYNSLVTRIETSARRMNEMVGDLLDFTRTQFGGDSIPITRAEMDVARMVQDVVSEVSARYPEWVLKVETHGELRGRWDSARLTQALTNLVSNAVQHGARGSPIVVAAHGTADEVRISVQNQGPVISPEEVGQMFKAGERRATVDDDEHLGLGLFIVDRIVAAHQGTIDVRSTNEAGTTFTVRLPRAA